MLLVSTRSTTPTWILQEKWGRAAPDLVGQPRGVDLISCQSQRERPSPTNLARFIIGMGGSLLASTSPMWRPHVLPELPIARNPSCSNRRTPSTASPSRGDSRRRSAQESLLTALLLEEGQTPPETLAEPSEEMSAEQLKEYLENLRPEDFGKFNM